MVGIISDSHDNREALQKAVSLFNKIPCQLVVHAGDFVAPFAAQELKLLACPVKAVFGNCDGEKEGLRHTISAFGDVREAPLCFSGYGLEFLVTHTQFANKSYISSGKYDVLIYGHTHRTEITKRNGTLIINPGEAGGWVTGKSTVALLDPLALNAEIMML